MNDRAFSWCFIGTGTLAKQVAAEITETDRHRIASVYSRRSEAAEQFAKQYGGEACKTPEQAMEKAGVGGHKEINRSNLSLEQIETLLQKDVVKKQLDLLRFRNTCPVFTEDADIKVDCDGSQMTITWTNAHGSVSLHADFEAETYEIKS